MSFTILDTMKDHLSNPVIARMSDVIGSDAGQTVHALSGAIPGLFSSFSEASHDDSHAEALLTAISNQDDTILENLGNFFAGDKASYAANTGAHLLDLILGKHRLERVVGEVSKLSGLGNGSSYSLLGMLTPLILSVIKRKLLSEDRLDAEGISSMLTAQKQSIQAALPKGFMQHLGKPLNTKSHEKTTIAPVTVTDKVSDTDEHVEDDEDSQFSKIIPWLLLIAALIILFFLFTGHQSDNVRIVEEKVSDSQAIDRSVAAPDDAKKSQTKAVESTPAKALPVTSGSLLSELRNNLNIITHRLTHITDMDSAKAALPAIEAANSEINNLTTAFHSLPAPTKNAVQSLISSTLPTLQMLSNEANAIPGVGRLINPALNTLSENLQKFQ